jgi:hypothetical protein
MSEKTIVYYAVWGPTGDRSEPATADTIDKIREEYIDENYEALLAEYDDDVKSGYADCWDERPDRYEVAKNICIEKEEEAQSES